MSSYAVANSTYDKIKIHPKWVMRMLDTPSWREREAQQKPIIKPDCLGEDWNMLAEQVMEWTRQWKAQGGAGRD